MKQIVFVTGTMSRGGAERVISLLSRRYAELGWRVRILTLLHRGVEYELDPAVEVIDFSNDKVKASLDIPRLVFKVRAFVKREKPDVVAAFMAPICLIAGLACRGLKTWLLVSERNDPADVAVMQTERAKNYFSEDVRKNSIIIPNPISVAATATEPKKRIVTAGRLEPQKNHEMLIRAFANIHRDYPDYRLDIYGDGGMKPRRLRVPMGVHRA